ncbi:hypothetical protein NL108_016677 [Boleophthalmus pectinirostris]|nr:hypothetical protein NL108_016677 [Boleophthalmus pectinirostris]
MSHGTEHSAGVATLKYKFTGDVLLTKCDPDGHFICQIIKFMERIFITCNIYGYNSKKDNEEFFKSIENILIDCLAKFPDASLLLGGDFNVTVDSATDRWPPGRSSLANNNFTTFMDKFNLEDVWRTKYPNYQTYTWSNKTGSNQ